MKENFKEKPSWPDIAVQNIQLKKYWSQWDRVIMKNDILYRKWIHSTTEETILQLIVPNELKQEILEMLHDDVQSGHLGISKTTARVQNRFYWLGYKQDIIKHLQNCHVCNSRKQSPTRSRSRMKRYNVGVPLERVAMYLVGPFPLSYRGNKYALVVSDYFTKWAEGYPLPDMEAHTVVDSFIKNFICRFGIPRQIHTDQGGQFESNLFKELCEKLRIHKTRTTAFRPQSDGLVERLNRSIEDIISKYVCKNQRDWDEQLHWALMAYRSSEHETTKLSPCMLMLGREIELPIDLMYGPHPQRDEFPTETEAANSYVHNLETLMWKIQQKARKNIISASEKQKRQYDIKANQNAYKVGEPVWLNILARVKHISPKLQRHWDGPYIITEVISDVIYRIQKNPSSKFQVVHHDRLKPFYGKVDDWFKIPETKSH
ncbi:Hypothetical predicted protein [Mytilus galloprovincialis]|uniref:Integrase catalytic domain-containing protein n=1 Tax=Mytilus galloprovincialis TaxID=29158 RepID=A0A8B6DV17_MYTGA|nr:Hypothetical predicted protein [Mytilus galloprovincialis]